MQARDLQEWAESPEAFHHETEAGAWEDHPRACAERLLMTLVKVQYTTWHTRRRVVHACQQRTSVMRHSC